MIIYTINIKKEPVAGFQNKKERDICIEYLNFLESDKYEAGEMEVSDD